MRHNTHNLSRDQLFEILEHIYNEVYVLDKDMNVIYVNPACYRNYGLTPAEMIGKNHNDFTGNVWFPSIVPDVYREKRRMCVEQVVYTGKRVVSTANPVLDEQGDIDLVVCVTQETFEHLDLHYNPEDAENTAGQLREQEAEDFGEIIAVNKEMKALYQAALRTARQDLPVLLQGESGTGKSMLAKFIHESGHRKNGRYVAVNCAAIPASLLEAELFGYKPHAFTGADPKGKPGLMRLADNGTIFLDEIAELTLPLQAKLLDVLENKTFIPIGGNEIERVDVRIVAATNKDLQDMVHHRTFREDLYWRINVVEIKIPPLRHRPEDIALLAHTFLQSINAKYNSAKTFSEGVMDVFAAYHWPGNIRQLKNAIERAVVISSHTEITVDDLPQNLLSELDAAINASHNYETYKTTCLKNIICASYEKYTSSRKIADALGISQTTATRLIKKYVFGDA